MKNFLYSSDCGNSTTRQWGSLQNGSIVIEALTSETLEGAIDVIRETFFTQESVSLACEVLSESGASEELEELNKLIAQDGVSLIARDVNSSKVVAVSINKLDVNFFFNYLPN